MTLLQLRYFKALANKLHYTKAAAELYISQPSLSYAISELEKEIGVSLFDRRNKKIYLSRYGEIFLTYVEKSLATLDEGRKVIEMMVDPAHGTVKLGYFYSISTTFIPQLIEKFYQQDNTSSLVMNFQQGFNDDLIKSIKSGAIDLAFCLHQDSELICHPVMEQQLYVIVPPNHRLADHKEIVLFDLVNEPMVCLDVRSALHSFIINSFEEQNLPHPKISIYAQECNAILQYVSLNFGISIIPEIPAIDAVCVVKIPLAGVIGRRPIYLTWSPDRVLIPPAEKLKSFVIEHFCADKKQNKE